MTNHAQAMRVGKPEVHFDIALGESYEYVSFDYSNYQQYLLFDKGIDPLDVARLNIFITDKQLGNNPNSIDQFYWPSKGEHVDKYTIRLRIPDVSSEDEEELVSRSLLHETRHFTDYIQGNFGYRTRLLGRFVNKHLYKISPHERSARRAEEDKTSIADLPLIWLIRR